MTVVEAAQIAGINKNTASSIVRRYNQAGGHLIERKRGGRRKLKLTTDILDFIEKTVEANPCITLNNIRRKIMESLHITLCVSTINNGLKRLRITLKSISTEVDRLNAAETILERKTYAKRFTRFAPSARERIIFIDECTFNSQLRRRKARSRVNTPALVVIPTVRGRNVSLLAAMNVNGILSTKTLIGSTANSTIFCDFLSELFRKLDDENIAHAWLVLDNARIHKTQEVHDLVAQTSHQLTFLPPYSPMLNPIEQVFSKIKLHAKQLLAEPKMNSSIVDVIKESAATITAADCNNYVQHMLNKLPLAANGTPMH